MAPKRHEHITHHHLENTKTSTRLQDIKKMPSLSPRKTSYYHVHITKDSAKPKIRNFIQMQTWEQTSTLTFRPIQITHPSYPYHLYFYKISPQMTPTSHPMHRKYQFPPLIPYIHLHALPQHVDIMLAMFSWVFEIGLHTVYLTYPPRTHHHITILPSLQ